jgi:hypothetical protein
VDARATAAVPNQLHRWPADERLIVEALSPRERRHIPILVHRLVFDEAKAFPERRADIRVRAVVEQQARELVTVPQANGLRNDAGEQGCMAPEPLAIHGRPRIDVGVARQQPACDLHLVVIHTHV